MGFLGEEPVCTPNLDRFATQKLVLDSVSATYPVCSPFRAHDGSESSNTGKVMSGVADTELRIQNVTLKDKDRLEIRWSISDETVIIEAATSLHSTNLLPVAGPFLNEDIITNFVIDALSDPSRFFRVRVEEE